MKTFINMLKAEAGASAAEAALFLAFTGSVLAIAALGLPQAIGGAMEYTAACMNAPPSAVS
jgi:pilus assembly protein Flp/PilA